MLTIIGSGMSPSKISCIKDKLANFDAVVCDKSYELDTNHTNIKPFGFKDAQNYILQNYLEKNIAYIVSGSPFFYSGATNIIKFAKEIGVQIEFKNAKSSKDYVIEKLFIAENELSFTSWHGRENIDLKELFNKKYTLILCDEFTPKRLHEEIKFLREEAYKITVCSRLGYEDENFYQANITEICDNTPKMPFVLLLEKNFTNKAAISSDDELLYERGMFTKEYKRHLILQLLELKPNMALWDIGAGSGSISVDAHKTYKIKSILFEKDENRCKYIVQNLQNHNILGAKLHIGSALENIQNETTNPDRIFMGGGGTELIQNLESVLNRLKPNGIFVAAIVSLANLSQIINKLDALNIVYDVKALSLTTYKTKLQISEPERQIFLLKVIK